MPRLRCSVRRHPRGNNDFRQRPNLLPGCPQRYHRSGGAADARSGAMTKAGEADEAVLAAMRRWLERAVIGLNLCPFAKAVHARGQIRWVVSGATTEDALLAELAIELQRLAATPPDEIDTTLLVHPQVLQDFGDYSRFLPRAEVELAALGLGGTLQLASFHPQYCFRGNLADDVGNNSNRAPHPTLHLLRESSIDRAVAAFPDASRIYGANIAMLQALGTEGWEALWRDG
jgi:hypothetical protein